MNEREGKLRLPEILGVPKKGIIFSDLDGVWFDEKANFASPPPEDLAIIQEAKETGYWVVLNSDTGASPLARYSQELGCSPLVIAENGMVTYAPSAGIKEFFVPIKSLFEEFKKNAADMLEFQDNSVVILGDATAIVREDPLIPYKNNAVFLINDMRECSFGVYIRSTDQFGKMNIDTELTNQVKIMMDKLSRNAMTKWSSRNLLLVCKSYPEVGSCLVRDPRVYKAQAVAGMIAQFSEPLEYYMIGNSLGDAMDFQCVGNRVTTCAVGNADPRLKEIATRTGGIIAPEDSRISKGANYIIQNILQRG